MIQIIKLDGHIKTKSNLVIMMTLGIKLGGEFNPFCLY